MRSILALVLLALTSVANAQTSVRQSGTVTPGHVPVWVTTGVIGDGGSATNGALTSLGVTASGPAICQRSGSSGAFNRICLTATATSGGITMDNIGGATGGFTFTLNGVVQGLATVTLPVTTNDVACFADTTGTLKDCGGGFTPITPSQPDTVEGFFTVTSTASSGALTMVGASFAAADVGKYLTCIGPGNSTTENRMTGTISTVTDATHITLSSNAGVSLSAVSILCFYGSDQSSNLQAVFTSSATNNRSCQVPAGIYLVATGLTILPPSANNTFNITPPLCAFDSGATIVAVASMTALVTYGSEASDYSGYLRQATFGGGTLDGNFLANYGVSVPFAQISTRSYQQTKNTLLAGVRWGSLTAPTASPGNLDQVNTHTRDAYKPTVSAITKANPAVVTMAQPVEWATGRVITLIVTGMTQANLKFFRITRVSATSFSLDNTDSSAWSTFTGGYAALTMTSMSVPTAITAITQANPGVVTATGHGLSNGDIVFIANVGGMTQVDGQYTVAGAAANTFQLSGTNTSAFTAYTSGGWVEKYPAPLTSEKGIYLESTADHRTSFNTISGTRWGIYAGSGGYNGQHEGDHIFNYDENGSTFAGYSLAGLNRLTDAQCDGPVRFCYQFSSTGNTMSGGGMTYTGSIAMLSNYANFVRLDATGSVSVTGGYVTGDASFPVASTVSPVGLSPLFSANYTNFYLRTTNTTVTIPDSTNSGSFFVFNTAGGASIQARGSSFSGLYACDSTVGHLGMYFSSGVGVATVNTQDQNCAFTGNPLSFTATSTILPAGIPLVFTGSGSGTLTMIGPAAAGSNTLRWPAGTTDFSATGGTSQVVKQTSSGGAFTVARLACADLSDSSSGCSAASGITALTGDVTATGPGSVAATIANNAVTLAKLATQATNTVLGNATSGTAVPTALAVGTCSTAASALIWTTNTGFGCNTSITAAAVPVGGITGLGTGVATALAVNVGSAGAFVTFNGALGSPSSAGTLPAHSWGGTVSGGGNQLNNVIIGTTTPLAGTFTAITGSSVTANAGNVAATNGSGAVAITATGNGAGQAIMLVCNLAATHVGMYFYESAGSAGFAVVDNSCAFTASAFAFTSAGKVEFFNSTEATTTTDGGARFDGGLSLAKNIVLGGKIFAANLATTTAALAAAVCWTVTTGELQRDTNAGGCLVSAGRYKHDIEPLASGLDTVMAMRPVSFAYNDNVGIAGPQVGFIADELARVEPRLVGFNPDGEAQSVRYMQLTAVLTKAIQELKADNDNLRSEFEQLKRSIAR